MAAALLRRALHIRRVLPSPTSPLPAASALRLLSSFTPPTTASQQSASTPIDLSDESRRLLGKSLLFQVLELDRVLGSWVEQHFHAMDEADNCALLQVIDHVENPDMWKWLYGLEQPPEDLNSNPVFSAIKSKITENLKNGKDGPKYGNQENSDLWKWLRGEEQPPEDLNSDPVFSAIKSKITGYLTKHALPETRSTPGQPWVRGWDDMKTGKDGPKYGNQENSDLWKWLRGEEQPPEDLNSDPVFSAIKSKITEHLTKHGNQ